MKRLLVLLLLVLPAFAASPGVEVKTEVDKAKVEVGQTVRLTIDLLVDPNVDLTAVPAEKVTFAPFEVRDAARTSLPAEGDRRKVRYTFKLAAYEEGKLKIPAASFPYKNGDASQVATSQELTVDVGRVPSGQTDKQGEIRDLKPAVASPIPTILYVAGAVALVVGLLLLRALVNRLRRKKSKIMIAEPPLPPFEHAMRELARLERERLPEQDRHEEYYDRLTAALRSYLSWRYGVPMLERTSSEILADVRRQEILPAEQFAELKRILEEGDLVKFARFGPPAATCDARLATARSILEFARPSEPERKPARELVGAGGPR